MYMQYCIKFNLNKQIIYYKRIYREYRCPEDETFCRKPEIQQTI